MLKKELKTDHFFIGSLPEEISLLVIQCLIPPFDHLIKCVERLFESFQLEEENFASFWRNVVLLVHTIQPVNLRLVCKEYGKTFFAFSNFFRFYARIPLLYIFYTKTKPRNPTKVVIHFQVHLSGFVLSKF